MKRPVRWEFSLITNVMQFRHIIILEDWLEFFDWPPSELLVVVGQDERIVRKLNEVCSERGLELSIIASTNAMEIRSKEPHFLRLAFEQAKNLVCLVHLDTVPFRDGKLKWQERAFSAMLVEKALFLTGATRIHRSDAPTSDPDFLRTLHVSNNFLIIDPCLWIDLQSTGFELNERVGRFATEAVIERYCRDTGRRGLISRNRFDWRIFHTQEWGSRMIEIRNKMHSGEEVRRFLSGYEEDHTKPSERWYCYNEESRIERVINKTRASLALGTRIRQIRDRLS